jgi:hypothetical protein
MRLSARLDKDLEEHNSMGRIVWIVIALLVFGYTLWPSVPAFAAYGAMAWDEESGKAAMSWNEPTAKRAEEVAIRQCGADGCKVVYRFGPKLCGAMATTKDGKYAGAAKRPDREAARTAALKACEKKKGGECSVRFADCNK